MYKFIIPILLISRCCFCQSVTDYDIYSSIINAQLENWKVPKESNNEIVITDSLTTFSQRIDLKDYAESYFSEDKSTMYMAFNYKESLIKLGTNLEFKDLYHRFATNYNKSRKLDPNNFHLFFKVKIVPSEEIENLFSKNKPKGFDKAWKKFYKKYPTTLGYFELSNIEYSDNFALVYLVHRAKPLIGSGELIIMKKVDKTWKIYESLDLWME